MTNFFNYLESCSFEVPEHITAELVITPERKENMLEQPVKKETFDNWYNSLRLLKIVDLIAADQIDSIYISRELADESLVDKKALDCVKNIFFNGGNFALYGYTVIPEFDDIKQNLVDIIYGLLGILSVSQEQKLVTCAALLQKFFVYNEIEVVRNSKPPNSCFIAFVGDSKNRQVVVANKDPRFFPVSEIEYIDRFDCVESAFSFFRIVKSRIKYIKPPGGMEKQIFSVFCDDVMYTLEDYIN